MENRQKCPVCSKPSQKRYTPLCSQACLEEYVSKRFSFLKQLSALKYGINDNPNSLNVMRTILPKLISSSTTVKIKKNELITSLCEWISKSNEDEEYLKSLGLNDAEIGTQNEEIIEMVNEFTIDDTKVVQLIENRFNQVAQCIPSLSSIDPKECSKAIEQCLREEYPYDTITKSLYLKHANMILSALERKENVVLIIDLLKKNVTPNELIGMSEKQLFPYQSEHENAKEWNEWIHRDSQPVTEPPPQEASEEKGIKVEQQENPVDAAALMEMKEEQPQEKNKEVIEILSDSEDIQKTPSKEEDEGIEIQDQPTTTKEEGQSLSSKEEKREEEKDIQMEEQSTEAKEEVKATVQEQSTILKEEVKAAVQEQSTIPKEEVKPSSTPSQPTPTPTTNSMPIQDIQLSVTEQYTFSLALTHNRTIPVVLQFFSVPTPSLQSTFSIPTTFTMRGESRLKDIEDYYNQLHKQKLYEEYWAIVQPKESKDMVLFLSLLKQLAVANRIGVYIAAQSTDKIYLFPPSIKTSKQKTTCMSYLNTSPYPYSPHLLFLKRKKHTNPPSSSTEEQTINTTIKPYSCIQSKEQENPSTTTPEAPPPSTPAPEEKKAESLPQEPPKEEPKPDAPHDTPGPPPSNPPSKNSPSSAPIDSNLSMTSTYSSLAPAPSTAFYGSSVPPAYPPPLSSVPYSTPLPPINPLGPSFATQTYNYGMPYANCNNYPYVNFNTNPFYSYPPSNPNKTILPSTMNPYPNTSNYKRPYFDYMPYPDPKRHY